MHHVLTVVPILLTTDVFQQKKTYFLNTAFIYIMVSLIILVYSCYISLF